MVGGNGESAEELVERAAQLNSERMVLVGPDALDSAGKTISGVFMAAAVAGVIASNRDPAVPLNGAEVKGLGGVAQTYSDNEVDLLVRGGVTPMESCLLYTSRTQTFSICYDFALKDNNIIN